MKFIFPKNYDFKPKLLGIIDYTTAIVDSIIGIGIFLILNIFISDISVKINVFILMYLPVILFSIFGINKENCITVMRYMIKFFKNQNVYLYKKNDKY